MGLFSLICCKRRSVSTNSMKLSQSGRCGRTDTTLGRTAVNRQDGMQTCRAGRGTPGYANVHKGDFSTTSCRAGASNVCTSRDYTKRASGNSIHTFIATNKEIDHAAREGPAKLKSFIQQLIDERRQLNGVNISTLFHRSARAGLVLPDKVVVYLADTLKTVDAGYQAISNICWSLGLLKNAGVVHYLLSVLTVKMEQSDEIFIGQQIGSMLYGLQEVRDSPEVRGFLRVLEPRIREVKGPFSSQTLGNACWGLRSLDASPEVRSIVTVLTERIKDFGMNVGAQVVANPSEDRNSVGKQSSAPFRWNKKECAMDGQAIGSALYGMQTVGDTPEVRQLVAAVAKHLEKLETPMKPQELAIGLYGLKNFQGMPPEVQYLLPLMAKHIRNCTDEFGAHHICSSLFALRWIGDFPETRAILAAMAKQVKKSTAQFTGQSVGNSLYGLQSFGCSEESLDLLEALVPLVQECKEPLKSQEVGNAFYGLRSVGDSLVTRKMMATLIHKLKNAGPLDPQAISNALYGWNALGRTPQMKEFLKQLVPKIKQCRSPFKPQSFANAMYGMQSMPDSVESRSLLAALTEKMRQCDDPFKSDYLATMIYNLRSMADSEEVRALLRLLKPRIAESSPGTFSGYNVAILFQGAAVLGNSTEVHGILGAIAPQIQAFQNMVVHNICTCLCGMRAVHDSADVRLALKALGSQLQHCQEPLTSVQIRRAKLGLQNKNNSAESQSVLTLLTLQAGAIGTESS